MRKKIYFLIIFLCLMLCVIQITILATDIFLPRNNVATTTTNISVFKSGRAIINLRYTGYPDITNGAEITVKIEKKKSMFIWDEVISRSYQTDDVYHINRFEYPLTEMGTYRFTITYKISGTAGKDDTITVCREKVYDADCPVMPSVYGAEDFNHDCTSEECCEDCYKIIGASPHLSHLSSGTWTVYDNDFHYSNCVNDTVSTANCSQDIKEKHRFDENLICQDCKYKKLTFTERLDEANDRVTIELFADEWIWARVDQAWLESDAYELVPYEYWGVAYEPLEEGGFEVVERKYMGNYVQYKTMKEHYTIHIPLHSYESCKHTGIVIHLRSQKKTFTFILYPSLELE